MGAPWWLLKLELVFVSLLHPLDELEGSKTLYISRASSLPHSLVSLLTLPSPSGRPLPLLNLLSPSLNLGNSSSSQE